jgi:hypothetical protein
VSIKMNLDVICDWVHIGRDETFCVIRLSWTIQSNHAILAAETTSYQYIVVSRYRRYLDSREYDWVSGLHNGICKIHPDCLLVKERVDGIYF